MLEIFSWDNTVAILVAEMLVHSFIRVLHWGEIIFWGSVVPNFA